MLAAIALACVGPADAGDNPAPPPTHSAASGPPLRALIASGRASVETVLFAGQQGTVRVVRGLTRPRRLALLRRPLPLPPPAPSRQIVSFGDGIADQVTVVRGIAAIPVSLEQRVERVSFADPRLPAVTIVRGIVSRDVFAADLFGPANGGELDRIAFAVDGIESRHGADPGMWRPEPEGPQGPMQVSAAAAFDVGGGDRFDLRQNRLLGRAYLAQMFRRYGNWPDALAAYNWGPGNVDQWIAGGRDPERLPPSVAYYVARVLRDALIPRAAGL